MQMLYGLLGVLDTDVLCYWEHCSNYCIYILVFYNYLVSLKFRTNFVTMTSRMEIIIDFLFSVGLTNHNYFLCIGICCQVFASLVTMNMHYL